MSFQKKKRRALLWQGTWALLADHPGTSAVGTIWAQTLLRPEDSTARTATPLAFVHLHCELYDPSFRPQLSRLENVGQKIYPPTNLQG